MAFIISPLFIGVTSFVYIDVILEELLSPSITNSKLPAVIRDAPFPEFDQSINQCSEVNLTSLHSKHAHYMQHKTIINDQFTLHQPY